MSAAATDRVAPQPARAAAGARSWIWALAVVQLPFMWVASAPLVPPDIWWTLKLGALVAATGQLDHAGALTYTALPGPQVNAQWSAQVLYHAAFQLGGLETVVALSALCAAATFGLVYLACRETGAPAPLAALCTLIGMSASITNFGARPQIFSYPLFALTLWLLLRSARHPRALLGIPPTVVLWTNFHGSFPLGVVLVGIFLTGALLERIGSWRTPGRILREPRVLGLAATTLASVLAIGINPYGFGILGYVAGLSSNPIVRQYVTEWWPTSVADATGLRYFATVIVFVAAAQLARHKLTPTEGLLALTFAALGLQSIRAVIWWGLVAAPLLTRLLGDVSIPASIRARVESANKPVGSRWLFNAIIAVFWAVALLAALPWLKPVNPLLPLDKRSMFGPETPLAAAELLAADPQGTHMFNYQGWGGFLGWRLAPAQRAFIDGRIEVHPPAAYLDYLEVEAGSARWNEILARYSVDHLVLSHQYQGLLISLAREDPGWRNVYEDELAVVFVRSVQGG